MDFLICLWYVICIVGAIFYFTEAGIAFRLDNKKRIYISLLICLLFILLGLIPKINELAEAQQLKYTREQLSHVKSKEDLDTAFTNIVHCKNKDFLCGIGTTTDFRIQIFNRVSSQYDLGKYK